MADDQKKIEEAEASAIFERPEVYDFWGSLRFLRLGGGDPTLLRGDGWVITSVDTADGPAVLRLTDADPLRADAWGPGARIAIQRAEGWFGLTDTPVQLGHLHPVIRRLERANPGLHLPNTGDVFQGLIRTIPQQLVSWNEAAASWGRMARGLGRIAPAPGDRHMTPTAAAIRACSQSELQRFGLLPKMARCLIECARRANRLNALATLPLDEFMRKVQVIRGVGPWSAGQVAGFRLGHPDAVITGDLGLPHSVAYTLIGKEESSDEEMLDLLDPFRPHRFRVIRLIMHAGSMPPRRAPRGDLSWRRK